MKIIIIAVLCLLLIGGFLFWKFAPPVKNPLGPKVVTLTYWDLWEDDNLIKPVVAQYQILHPNITINLVRQSLTNYRTRVQTQIRAGSGPDIFMIHNSWLPMFSQDLAPAPSSKFSLGDYQNTFYPVAVEAFIKDNKILAAPTQINGLALYINEDILNGVGLKPPKNWGEFMDMATKMTVVDPNGTIKTAGAAMGITANVDYWSDILGLLLLQQPGIDLKATPVKVATPSVAEVVRFYTGFALDPKRKTWDVSMPNSTDAFIQGRLAMYFAPFEKASQIRKLNPNLKFKVVPVPQLANRNISWATFWAQAVSLKSAHPQEAWDFIKYLTSQEAEKSFGQPYSRVDLANDLASDPLVGAFITQGPNYKFWYLSSNTFDNGINDEMIKVWEDGIKAILKSTDPQVALQQVEQGTRQILDKYTKPAPAASGQNNN